MTASRRLPVGTGACEQFEAQQGDPKIAVAVTQPIAVSRSPRTANVIEAELVRVTGPLRSRPKTAVGQGAR